MQWVIPSALKHNAVQESADEGFSHCASRFGELEGRRRDCDGRARQYRSKARRGRMGRYPQG